MQQRLILQQTDVMIVFFERIFPALLETSTSIVVVIICYLISFYRVKEVPLTSPTLV